MTLQPQERPDRHPDVVALRPPGPRLAPLHAAALLQAPVIVLDRPGLLGQAQPRQLVHRQVVGRPVLSVPVSGDDPEDPDQTVTFQVDDRAAGLDRRRADGLEPLPVEVDPAVDLQPRQPAPAQAADQLEVLQAAVPAVEGDAVAGRSLAPVACGAWRRKWSFLVRPSLPLS